MKVSVIVPTYRRAQPLTKALASLANQKYRDFEIVIIDDNDETEWNAKVEKIVSDFTTEHEDCSIKYIQNHPNRGSANARNIGIEVAEGKYITFLDDDDLYMPEKIEHQLGFMESEDADYSITDLFLYNENDKLVDKRTRTYIDAIDEKSLLTYHLMYHMTGTDTMMFKKDYLTKIGGFPPIDVGDEFYLMVNAIKAGGKFVYANGCYVKAYVHTGEGGLSSGQGKIDGENALYEHKSSMFDELDKKTIRYIKMRHHAVLAFAYLRMKKYVYFFVEGIKSFSASPKECLNMLRSRA